MTTTYRLNVSELSIDLIQSIKEVFKNRDIEITVTDATDETEYLLATETNRRYLQQADEELKNGGGTTFTLEELQHEYGGK